MFVDPLILAQIGVGWLFIRYLIQKDRGTKEPKFGIFMACFLGGLATVGAIFLEKWLLPDNLIEGTKHLQASSLFYNSLLVGVIEESLKSLPLAIFLFGRKYFNELNDGILYFAAGGMVFGVIENIGYELAFPGSGFVRLLTGPYLHAGFCALFGYMLARKKILRRSWILVAAGLGAAIAFHGLYDFGLFYSQPWSVLMSLAITLFINLNLFYLLKQTYKEDAKLGFAASAKNYYCPNCGRPNPDRYLYCVYCGHKT